MQTRYEERQKKRKQNLILNGLIVIVLIFIVIVGAQLVSSPSSQMEASNSPEENEHLPKQTDEEESTDEIDELDNKEADSVEEENIREEDGYRFVGGGPDGPWEPIGTKQTGEHVTQYTRDSLDWQEMEMALAYGAGIDHSHMTIIWIGNGGDPQRAKGQVKSDGEPNTIFHVTIEWIDEAGWKPIEVQIE